MQLKILVTGKNRKVANDICGHLEADRGYVAIKCDPHKTALFDVLISELPKVVIICLGDETSATVQAYDVMRSALSQGNITTIVVTNNEDEKMFIQYSGLERVFFLSRPVSLFALYEKLSEIEKTFEDARDRNLSAFREYVNEDAGKSRRKQILVIDDDTEQLIHIKEQIEEFYNVTCVKSGADAFRYLEKNTPDLILLDYLMPTMDGPEVLRNIQYTEEWEDIPVIFLTGMAEKDKVVKTLAELKPQGYIVKPARKSEVVAKIIDILG